MSLKPMGSGEAMALCAECGMPTDGRSCVNPRCSASSGVGWAAASAGAANDYYLGSRLAYGPVDDRLAGIVTPEMVKAFFVKALAVWLVCLAVTFFLAAPLVVSGNFRAGLIIGGFLYLASFVVFFIPFRAPASGWHFVLDDKAAAADSAFAHIYMALRRRETPVEAKPKRILGPDRATRNYLRLRHGQFSAYVSVFPYGRDLFVGWTIWWEILPLSMLWTFLVRQMGLSYFELVVRSDEVQAFREVVHSATREGVDVANLGVQVPIATAFGSEVPVEAESTVR
jgi:hypothetical protein